MYDKSNNLNKIKYTQVKSRLQSFKNNEDGTYDYETGKRVNLKTGYMVSFHQNEPNENGHYKSHYGRYTDEEYNELTNIFAIEFNAHAFVGVFDNEPEISFKVETRLQAMKLAQLYNQESIWDNRMGSLGNYARAQIKNNYYDKTKKSYARRLRK